MAVKGTDIVGLEELIRAFEDIGNEAMPRLKQAADAAGAVILAKTKAKVPVATGNLRAGLKLKIYPVRFDVFITTSHVTFPSRIKYGVPLELGHKLWIHRKKYKPVEEKPYLRPAADESTEQVLSIMVAAMNKALAEIGGMR